MAKIAQIASNGRQPDADLGGDLAVRVTVIGHFEDPAHFFFASGLAFDPIEVVPIRMLAFGGVLNELKPEHSPRTSDSNYRHIRGVEPQGAVSGFYVFQVAEVACLAAMAHRKDVIGKVREHLRALQVVYGDARA